MGKKQRKAKKQVRDTDEPKAMLTKGSDVVGDTSPDSPDQLPPSTTTTSISTSSSHLSEHGSESLGETEINPGEAEIEPSELEVPASEAEIEPSEAENDDFEDCHDYTVTEDNDINIGTGGITDNGTGAGTGTDGTGATTGATAGTSKTSTIDDTNNGDANDTANDDGISTESHDVGTSTAGTGTDTGTDTGTTGTTGTTTGAYSDTHSETGTNINSDAAPSTPAPSTPAPSTPAPYTPAASATQSGTPFSRAESLLEARRSVISVKFDHKDLSQQQAITSGSESIKNTFRDIKNTIGNLPPELFGSEPIDWDFWARTVEDYHEVVLNHQDQLSASVAAGIPKQIRGIIWQLVAQSKNLHLEELYLHLKTEPSVHEKAIKRDLTRTSFYASIESANKTNELYNVIAAYSNFDPDVGYTQGMVFIVVPLIMNMTEAECFCLLVTLMKEYGLRQLFSPEMRGLHLLLYQYDRLLEQNSALLYNHMCMQGIQSSMYASQWFLTFFSYKFPLDVVLRIFDMIITQGVEAVLRLGLNLVLRNEEHLLRLSFDSLLEFLKTSLFDVYTSDEEEVQENKRFSLLSLKAAQKKTDYRLDAFITDSMSVVVNPRELAEFSAEFDKILALDVSRTEEIARVGAHNAELRQQLQDVELQYTELDLAHSEHVSSLVAVKVKLPEIVNEITDLREAVTLLEAKIQALDCATTDLLPQDIEAEIQSLLGKNAIETERFATLDEEFNQLTLEEEKLDEALKANKKWFW